MAVDETVLWIDAEAEAQRICEFIRAQVFSKFRRKGVVVGLSGGVDSALLACLSVQALGPERVFGIIYPEKESSPESAVFAAEQAKSLGIDTEVVDITPILTAFGVYEERDGIIRTADPTFDPENDKKKISLPQDLLHRDRLNVFSLIVEKPNGEKNTYRLKPEQLREIASYQNIKQRTRMIQLYHFAEKLHFVVGGTTNRPEMDQGFFVKFEDGGVDFKPQAHLYKTQVFQIGEHVGVIREILDRAPTPDTWSGAVTDEEFYFRMPFDKLDLLLYAWNEGLSASEASASLGLHVEQVERAYRDFKSKKQTSWHLRAMPPNLVEGKSDIPAGERTRKPE